MGKSSGTKGPLNKKPQFPAHDPGASQANNLLAPRADRGLSRRLPPFMASASQKAKAAEAAEHARVQAASALTDNTRSAGTS